MAYILALRFSTKLCFMPVVLLMGFQYKTQPENSMHTSHHVPGAVVALLEKTTNHFRKFHMSEIDSQHIEYVKYAHML